MTEVEPRQTETDHREVRDEYHRVAYKAVVLGVIVAGIGALVLVGWWLDITSLKSVLPGSVYMKANTAAGFVLAGLSLALWGGGARIARARQAAVACAGTAALIGLLTLCEYLTGVDLGIDQLLFRAVPGVGSTLAPGRMTPACASSFLLLGSALILAGWRRTLQAAQWLLGLTWLMGLLVLMGYLYGATARYGLGQYTQMAIHTAVLFMLASLGAYLLHPAEGLMRTLAPDTMGGWLLRRMMPFMVVGLVVLGWLHLLGERKAWFEGPLGVALMMATMMFLLAILVWQAARTLTRLDTLRRKTEEELRQLSRVVEQTPASVVITDTTGAIEYVNPAFTQLTGYTADEARGQNPRILKSGLMPAETYTDMWRELLAGREWRGELRNRGKNGELFWEWAVISPLRDAGGRATHYVAVKENITARKAMEDELRNAALTDKLTGLPNRSLFNDRLQQAVLRSQRLKGYHFAVLFLDLDRFKIINDSLGHDVGDLLLQEISRRLHAAVRTGDSLSRPSPPHTTARLGGDEFVVLLDGLSRPEDAVIVAERLLEVLARQYRLGAHELFTTANIGIVTSDVAADSADQVLRDADTAMYEAKLAGKGRYVVFSIPMRQRMQKRLNLEHDLRKALDGGQLFLAYEPIVSLQTGQIKRFEVLVRWKHPERGLVMPGEFIPIAEETGLILPMGEWILREACAQFGRWRRSLGDAAPPSISVNLSRSQLMLQDLPETIRGILEQTGMPAERLHLEVTESAVMTDAAAAIRTLQAIKAIGVKLDMDDFGTGYSSLACLHQFPIDVLKIDRSFVMNIERGRDYTALVHAVAQLARNLNIQVVAEGVETVDQALILQSLECEYGQGYFFGKAMPAEEAARFRVQTSVWAKMSDLAGSVAMSQG